MKMNRTILLIASVFLYIFVSCGIPVIFSIESALSAGNDSGTSVSGRYHVSSDEYNNLDLVEMGTGPSLMLFYTITQGTLVSTLQSQITTAFNTQYRKNGIGVVVPQQKLPVLSVTYDSTVYNLYPFSDATGPSAFSSPKYLLAANNPHNNELQFSLSRTQFSTTSQYTLDLTLNPVSDPYSSQILDNSLVRYNGQKFETSSTIINSNMLDYSNAMDSTDDYQCHIFAAMCVAEGSFNNTYWTPLKYLGYITLPSDNT